MVPDPPQPRMQRCSDFHRWSCPGPRQQAYLSSSLRISGLTTVPQGKLVPVPEHAPFRLTADMVDGLGTSSVDEVFRRCTDTFCILQEEQGIGNRA